MESIDEARGHETTSRPFSARKSSQRLNLFVKEMMSDDSYTRSALSEKHGFSHSWDYEDSQQDYADGNLKQATKEPLSKVMLRVISTAKTQRILSQFTLSVTSCNNKTKNLGKKSQTTSALVLGSSTKRTIKQLNSCWRNSGLPACQRASTTARPTASAGQPNP